MSTAGYSGTPLARKLGIKSGFKIKVFAPPVPYDALFNDWPENVEKVGFPTKESLDFIHVFALNSESLEELVPMAKPFLKKNGSFWVSWPKGTSGIPTDINRDIIRDYVLKIGLVDVKVAAIDDQWSGLKFMYRVEDR
ncbi:MAG: DUF3052 domain-containing protein [Flammeovirgaceae bacterium]|nr:DUF3052 domain-containing protein [Flammeovirgaceae bacterium]MBE61101.1 DUF3052 domain-containing protein [Flammeovirgaceae bacterium]MBR10925.1 DUF3052 domain-containing protein [Rickettsiales bacterium]HCX23753.1 DUF3052 domain-containing protein [Cytophagales bacterium]|tara:strand:- start:126 stop:539 length:414 start_codon:yes stop_codon:yes gene_type:complete